jgi:hypothetical protein
MTQHNQTEAAGQEHINESGNDYATRLNRELARERFGPVPTWEKVRTPAQKLKHQKTT